MDLRAGYEKLKKFVLRGLWSLEIRNLSRGRRFGFRWLRTLTLASHGFVADKCALRAAALTLVFLFSLPPTLAVGFAVAKGFNAQQVLKEKILDWPKRLPFVKEEFLVSILDYVDTTDVRAMGVLGILILLFTSYKLLSAIERTMNEIWGIRRQRRLMRKVVDYAAVVFVFPIMLMVTTIVTASLEIAPFVEQLATRDNAIFAFLASIIASPVLATIVGVLVALFFAAVGFTFLYFFFPNTRVRFLSAVVGGVSAAIMLYILQYIFVQLQVGVSKVNVVYGTFAAVPIFLVWLHASWLVVLFAAELSYAHANQKMLEFGGISFTPSPRYREQLAVGLMVMSARTFHDQKPPLTCEGVARALCAPVRVMREVIDTLVRARMLSELEGDENLFQPAAPLSKITIGRVIEAVHQDGDTPPLTGETLKRLGVVGLLSRESGSESPERRLTLLEVVGRKEQSEI